MSFSVITGSLSAAVAPAGTFTASYPSGKNAGSFFLAMGHKLTIGGNELFYPVDFDVTLGASITITNKSSTYTWPQSAVFRLQMEEMGDRAQLSVPMQAPNSLTETIGGPGSQSINVRAKLMPSTTQCYADLINLGAPVALDADGIAAAQNVSAGAAMTLNGALAANGAVTLDVPRCLSVDSGGADTAVLTINGTDVYGRSMSEAITLNGTTQVNGKKAFKTVSSITSSATTSNSPFVGTTDILGLPVFLPDTGFIVGELINGKQVGVGGGAVQVPFFINQTDLLAPTAAQLISPVSGVVRRATAIVQVAITTGGNIKFTIGSTDIVGLTLVFADGATAGTIASDTPATPGSATTLVTKGQALVVTPDASFATAGAVNGYIEIMGATDGVVVAGIRTAGGSTTTTGDVRGTYTPSLACDGTNVYQLLVLAPDRYAGIAQNVSGA